MKSVADLVEDEALDSLGPPGVIFEGRTAADAGRVRLALFGPLKVTASVDDAEVRLEAVGGELRWSCTCEQGRTGQFCLHAAATAVETWRRAPTRKRN